MVVFQDSPEKYNSAKMFRRLEEEVRLATVSRQPLMSANVSPSFFQMRRCIASEAELRKMDQEIALNPKYLQKLRVAESD